MMQMYINKGLTHGTRTTYIRHQCRCPECRIANSEYLKKYRISSQSRGKNAKEYEYQKISRKALDWVILNHPDVYEELKKGI